MNAVVNRFSQAFTRMFPSFFANVKHDYNKDFGFPDKIDFDLCYEMYRRNSIAKAAVDKTIAKCWVEAPWLLEFERNGENDDAAETVLEKEIRQRFAALRVWTILSDVDLRSLVGEWSCAILRFADGKPWSEPVGKVSGGLDALIEVIPAWQGQMTVSKWDEDQDSLTYGQPLLWEYDELAVSSNTTNTKGRKVTVHASRVVVWSRDGTLNGTSALEAGFNDLITMSKVVGSGGEGFWKNAKSSPVFTTQENADLRQLAALMNIDIKELQKRMSEQVENWQKGFDNVLMLQGMDANSMSINLPQPEEFFNIACQSFAASFNIPMKILVGTQTGERASTEDARDWSVTCNSRRANYITPILMVLVRKLVDVGVIRENPEWFIDWNDLTEASTAEKFDLASKMATINSQSQFLGVVSFTPEEIREIVDYEPLSEGGGTFELPEDDPEDENVPPKKKASQAGK